MSAQTSLTMNESGPSISSVPLPSASSTGIGSPWKNHAAQLSSGKPVNIASAIPDPARAAGGLVDDFTNKLQSH
jgi:hypothetical protein